MSDHDSTSDEAGMDWDAFADWGRKIADWGAEYHTTLRDRPVRAQVQPGQIADQIAPHPPETAEPMSAIMADFDRIILPGITHWQHPRFFAYFPANAAPPSILAEQVVNTMAAQCMLWQTSPAATELETCMIRWLADALGLAGFDGVIQDSASSATLAAVLTMRERALGFTGNQTGLSGRERVRIYVSDQAHISVERAAWVAGIGQDNLVRLPTTGPRRGVDPAALDAAIRADLAAGFRPAGVIAVTGATGMGACDDVAAICAVAKTHDLYVHLDAAWAGSAMICPEFRALWDGVTHCDSVVFNPHKWLGAQFDCAVQFLRDPAAQRRTLSIRPAYLETSGTAEVVNYSEFTVPLGRRFRALKLWFLIRAYGLDGLRTRIRNHVRWAEGIAKKIDENQGFEVVSPPILSLFTFRPTTGIDAQKLVDAINDDGRIYLTQTDLDGQRVIRFQVGQFDTTAADVDCAYDVICEIAANL